MADRDAQEIADELSEKEISEEECAEKERSIKRSAEVQALRDAILSLDIRYQRVILMRMNGLSLEEIGKQIGVTRERVRVMESRANELLRNQKLLRDMGLLLRARGLSPNLDRTKA